MKHFKIYSLIGSLITVCSLSAQNLLPIKVINQSSGQVLEQVAVFCNDKNAGETNQQGVALIRNASSGKSLHLVRVGFEDAYRTIGANSADTMVIAMTEKQKELEEVTIVASTRNNQRMENAPLKVEVLGKEEMTEESGIKPAGISGILGDISGVQIQQSSAVSGNSNVRIQGLDGRYTQILKDGMPLFDGFSGGFGILSIPPLDLRQIELIKGTSSTLYGGGAIGGLVNIITRKPTMQQEATVSINQTTLRETNFNSWVAKRNQHWGYSFFGGANYQKAADVNKDGLTDVPDWKGVVLHPKIYYYPTDRTNVSAGYTGTFETRKGGDMQVLDGNADAIHQYFETNTIARNSFELTAQHLTLNNQSIDFKSSLSSFERDIKNNDIYFRGRQINYFNELSVLLPMGTNNLVAGLNANGDLFRKLTDIIQLNNFSNHSFGVFVQDTWNLQENTTLEAGLRNDYHLTYGNFLLPRLAVFHRFNSHWAARMGWGAGYKTPNALASQNTDIAIQHILNLPKGIKAERSNGYNAEFNYKLKWEKNELFLNQAFFYTQLNNPMVAYTYSSGDVQFLNANKPVISKGFDTYVRAVISEWEIYAGYTFTLAERSYLPQNQFLILTPKNRFAFTLVRDFDELGIKAGLEGSYTGSQHREDYSLTPGYYFMAMMISKQLNKHLTVVLNGENLLNYRQSQAEALYDGTITHPVFHDLWAPIDGRVINLSVKWQL